MRGFTPAIHDMFSIDANIADLKVKERNIFKILYSMNSHPVALPGHASEEARCYILFFSEGPNLSSFIGLYLPRVDERYFYNYASNPFPFEAEKDVEDEARTFAEEMGFLLDEINVAGMAVEDRNNWIEEQLIFGYRKPEAAKTETEPAQQEPAASQTAATIVKPAPAALAAETEPETPVNLEVLHEEAPAPPPAPAAPAVPPSVPSAQPSAPAHPPAQQPSQPPYPQPQPMPQGYQPQPPPAEHIAPPELEHPEEPVEAQPKPKGKPAPAQPRVAARKKAPPAPPRPAVVTKAERELPVEFQLEPAEQRPRSLFEEAIKEGVVKPPKPKAVRTGVHSSTDVVSRDKEALARLLASF